MRRAKDIKTKTIVITGASSGIGKAAALAFAKNGSNLVLAARNETILQELASECESLGGHATPVAVDVTNKDSVKRLFDIALNFYDSIDVWINNAGVGAIGEYDETPLEAHEQVIRTNLFGSLYSAYYVVPYFKRQGRGTIITTNSTGAFIGAPLSAAYSASKFGLRGLTEALRSELKEFTDIHICDIYASFVDSPGMYHAANYMGKEVKPAPPLVNPEKIAEVMVKLSHSPRSTTHLGSMDYLGRFGHALFPRLTETIMNKFERLALKKADDVAKTDGNLFEKSGDKTEIHGGF